MADPIGEQAKGRAGVFGSSINPLQYYLSNRATQQKREQELMDQERKRRDEVIGDLRKFQPDKVWSPFFDEVNRYAQSNVHDRFYELSHQGAPLSSIERDLQKRKGETNTLVNKANFLKDQFDTASDQIEKNPYYKKSEAQSALNDVFFNGRQARPLSEINTDQIAKNVFDNTDLLDQNAVMVDFMKSLPNKVNQHYTEYWGQLGQQYNVQETTTKLGLQYDPKGNVVIDPRTGQPKISVTDDVLIQAQANPYVKKLVDKYVPDGNIQKQREVLTALTQGLDPKNVQNRPQMGFKRPDDDVRYTAYGRGFRTNPADLSDRYDWSKDVTENNRPDQLERANDPNSDNKAYYGDADGKPIKAGEKPSTIVLAHVGTPDADEIPAAQWSSMSTVDKLIWAQAKSPGRIVKETIIPVTTPEGKRKAQIALSNRLDKIDSKRSIGPDEFGNYVEARFKDEEKRKPKKGAGAFDDL